MASRSEGAELEVLRRDRIASASICAVAFDFDDTLVRLDLQWQEVMAEYFADAVYRHAGLTRNQRARRVLVMERWIRYSSGSTLTAFASHFRSSMIDQGAPVRTVNEYRAGFDELWQRLSDQLHVPSAVTPGAADLIQALSEQGISIFVVSGGDHLHKRRMIENLGLGGFVPSPQILGDGDPRFPGRFTKSAALRHIARLVGTSEHLPSRPTVAMIGDGRKDMEAAAATGSLAIGFNQSHCADAVIHGFSIPVARVLAVLAPPHEGLNRALKSQSGLPGDL